MTTAAPDAPAGSLLRLASLSPSPGAPALPTNAPSTRVGLSLLDKLAATALAGGDADVIVEQVVSRATAICDERDFGASERMLARRIAATEAALELVDVLLGKSVVNRDFEIVPYLERLSKMYSARLVRLVEAHVLHRKLSSRSAVGDGETVVVR